MVSPQLGSSVVRQRTNYLSCLPLLCTFSFLLPLVQGLSEVIPWAVMQEVRLGDHS